MTNNEQFVKAHWTQAIVLGIVAILAVTWTVISEEINIAKDKHQGVVLGETVADNKTAEKDKNEQILTYQNSVKNIINDYLTERARFDKPHQNWLFLIKSVKSKLLTMGVPDEYKELHLQLATTLDVEWQAVNKADDEKLRAADDGWDQILKKYFWLNK